MSKRLTFFFCAMASVLAFKPMHVIYENEVFDGSSYSYYGYKSELYSQDVNNLFATPLALFYKTLYVSARMSNLVWRTIAYICDMPQIGANFKYLQIGNSGAQRYRRLTTDMNKHNLMVNYQLLQQLKKIKK